MAAVAWEDSEPVNDEPRKLTCKEISNIIDGLMFSHDHNPVQDNLIHIHREKTRKKLGTIKIKPSKITQLKNTIFKQFYTSVIAPGEAVGVNAAQCIGEPTTQNTLNSVAPTEKLIIQQGKDISVVEIGPWIDNLLKDNDKVQHIPINRTEYLELDVPVLSPTPSASGHVQWDKVTAVTRHLPIGDLVKVTSRSGRSVTATRSKSLLVWDGEKLIQRGGGDVQIGDLVPIICDLPGDENDTMTYEQGRTTGIHVAYGSVSTNIAQYYKANLEFIKGFLNGYASVCGKIEENYIRLSCNPNFVNSLSVLCSRCGIVGDIEKDAYVYRRDWNNPFITTSKVNNVILDPIVSIETVPATEYVYDLTVPSTTNFSLWNGLGVADTFHSAGISAKNVTLGFPRAREIFNATHSPSSPTCTIYFSQKCESPKDLHVITDKLEQATVQDLLKEWMVYEPNNYKPEYWQNIYLKMHEIEITEEDWCLRLQFDVAKLYDHDITVRDIANKLEIIYADLKCIPSPLNLGIIDVIVDCNDISIHGARSKELSEITDDHSARNFYMNKIVSPKLRGQIICGVNGISKIYTRKASVGESFGMYPLKEHIRKRIETDEQWIVETDGTNLEEVLTIPGVDTQRTLSNDIWEILNIFGIEAARMYLYLEFFNIVNAGGGIAVNPVHIQVLVDKMCYTGSIRAIARFGVETAQYDPIARATFEEVMSQIITSAMFSEKDHLSGISSNIVLGTKINAGTGRVDLDDIPLKIVNPEKRGSRKTSVDNSVTTPGRTKIRPPIVSEEI